MKKTVTIALAAAICLTPLAASPAFAAAPSASVDSAHHTRVVTPPALDSIDVFRTSGTVYAQVKMVGGAPADWYYLVNTTTDENKGVKRITADGRLVDFIALKGGTVNHLEMHVQSGNEDLTIPLEADDSASALAAPEVVVVEHIDTGRAEITVTGIPGAIVSIRNPAEPTFGYSGTLTSEPRTFDLPLPETATNYTVTQRKDSVTSDPTPFSLTAIAADIIGAPLSSLEYVETERALLIVTGKPGSALVAKDASGKTIACKLLPASGGAQVWVPLAIASTEVTLTLTSGTLESASTSQALPAAS